MKKNNRAWLAWAGVLMACWLTAVAQPSKSQFKAERAVLLRRIKSIQQVLRQTATQKRAGLGQLKGLNRQIESNALLIQTLSQELQAVDQALQQKQRAVAMLAQDLTQLKQEYAAMVYAGAKALPDIHQLMLLFAAPSFHKLVQRLRHVKQYTRARNRHFLAIKKVKATLEAQRAATTQRKHAKIALLQARQAEKVKLDALKRQHTRLLGKLERQHTRLAKELKQRQRAVRCLDKLVTDVVQQAVQTRPAKPASAAQPTKPASTAARPTAPRPVNAQKLTARFLKSRGKLPWPVQTGFISSKFGTGAHPVLRNVQVENLGVGIQTQAGAQVRAVFAGIVKTIAFVPGMQQVVIIQHGAYHSVYAKLKHTTVSVGQYVQAQTPLGTVYTDVQGTTELQFQLWKHHQRLNPARWLCKK